jgi:hypothetical protein
MQQETIREAVGVFDDIQNLNEAVRELESTAFPRHDISVRDGAADKNEDEDRVVARLPEEDNPDAPRTILIRPEEKVIGGGVIAGGGFYAGAVTGMLIAGLDGQLGEILAMGLLGGIFGLALGGVVAWLLGHYYNDILRKQISEGRMILWVRTPGAEEETLACDIMKKHGGQRVHVHELH